jgi:hypothetical protein
MGVRITREQFSQVQEEVKYYERVRRYVFDSLIVQTPLASEDTSEIVLVMKKTSLGNLREQNLCIVINAVGTVINTWETDVEIEE